MRSAGFLPKNLLEKHWFLCLKAFLSCWHITNKFEWWPYSFYTVWKEYLKPKSSFIMFVSFLVFSLTFCSFLSCRWQNSEKDGFLLLLEHLDVSLGLTNFLTSLIFASYRNFGNMNQLLKKKKVILTNYWGKSHLVTLVLLEGFLHFILFMNFNTFK